MFISIFLWKKISTCQHYMTKSLFHVEHALYQYLIKTFCFELESRTVLYQQLLC